MWLPFLVSLTAGSLVLGLLAGGLRRRLVVVTVFGASMEPAYRPGQRLLASRVGRDIGRGQVVVLAAGQRATARLLIIKRVAAIGGDAVPACVAAARPDLAGTIVPPGYLIVLGDNPERSRDSRHDGLVPADRVRAVAIRSRSRPDAAASEPP